MIKVAIVGAGFMGETHAKCYQNIKDVQVAAIVDKSRERAEAFAQKFNCIPYQEVSQMTKDVADCLDICLPTSFHKDTALLGFKNGLDVLCEKPVSLIVQEAIDMDKAAKEAKRIFMVAQVVRFWPEYAHLTRLVKTGALKGIKQLTLSRYGTPPGWSEGNWMLSDKKSGGVIYDLAIHDIDYIVALLGMPKWIFAQRSMMGEDYTAYINVQFGYESMNVAAEVGFIMPGTYPFTAGFRLSTGYEALEYVNKKRNGLIRYSSQGEEKMVYDDYDPYQREIEHFLDCVKARKVPEIGSGQQAVQSLKVAQLIEKSVKINQRVEVE